MNTAIEIPTIPCTPFGGGFYMCRMNINGEAYAIIAAPKADGERRATWNDTYKDVPGAKSYSDGLANTIAMAEAGSEFAKWALALRIGGHDDWHIPSQDAMELMYRVAKPTTEENYLYARSGINVSAIPPTYPYTSEYPAQTPSEAFQAGGAEAFEPEWHWTSTQHPAFSDCAYYQYFSYGAQDYYYKYCELFGRVVRRLKL